MKVILFTQQVGLAILLGLAVQKTKLRIPTAEAAVIVRGGSTPFLIGPPDEVVSPVTSAEDDEPVSQSIFTTSATAASQTTSSTDTSSTPATSPISSSSSPATSTHSDPTPSPLAPVADIDSKQPSSIRYLVPVFLLILITLGGWAYSRWYASRKRRDAYAEAETEKQRREQERGNWKAVEDDGDGYDEKDPWYSGMSDNEAQAIDWQDVDLVPARSNGAISVAGRGWGWKSTMNVWKSARGKDYAVDAAEIDELGQKQTIKIVQPLGNSQTYQTLPDLAGKPVDPAYREERGSIRALREKLSSLSYKDMVSGFGKLDRNRAPNKRRTKESDVPPPELPAWIQPRAVSPTQVLSPPMQPHLFFHPAPSGHSLHAISGTTGSSRTASDSGSDYGSEDLDTQVPNDHARYPTIPSTADALASTYTAVPQRSPRQQRGASRSESSNDSTQSVVDGGPEDEPTPKPRRSQLKRMSTTPATSRRTTMTPSTTIRRSTATNDLASQSPSRQMTRRSTAKDKSTYASTTTTSTSPRKSRSQRKAEQAHDKVEDILKASWSDRALASPTSMSIDGMVAFSAAGDEIGTLSPGVEAAAVMSGMGGGIEQRLALLKRMDG